MKIEISILLGFNCNFRCGHCINSSKPGYRDYDLNSEESTNIVNSILKNKNIKKISFTGGEPLLYINEIEYIVESLRQSEKERKFIFTITSNGSLIKKNSKVLKKIKLNKLLLSYDTPHAEFFDKDSFEENLVLAKYLFQEVEITHTYSSSISSDTLTDIAIKNEVQVHFNKAIIGGRHTCVKNKNFNIQAPIKCPNLKISNDDYLKITYLPTKGYTICCGPLLFDNLGESNLICKDSIDSLLNSEAYLMQNKLAEIKVKCSSDIDCENCSEIIRNPTYKKLSKHLSNVTANNFVPISELTDDELNYADRLFRIRRIGISNINSFTSNTICSSQDSKIQTFYSSELTINEKTEVSDFIINNFYYNFKFEYGEKDIEIFKSQQNLFFKLKYSTLIHKIDSDIVSLLLVAQIENHSIYNRTVWQIGYWGINHSLKNIQDRKQIKSDWQSLLKELSSINPVVTVIDQFNTPSRKVAESFGIDLSMIRFDKREL